jgi:hypothetical protein
MALAVEISPRGAVHIHALYHGRRPDAVHLRALYMLRVGDSPQLRIDHVRSPRKAISEIAKYMTKAASPKRLTLLRGGRGEFVDPVLAARAEVALAGSRLLECLGAWRRAGVDGDGDEPEALPATCAHCGAAPSVWINGVLELDTWLAQAGPDWRPRFARNGPRPPPRSSDIGSHLHALTQGDAP